jgi:hypothetical protein
LFILPWAVAALGVIWILIQRFPPSGVISFDVPFNGTSAWIDPFLPAERTSPPGDQPEGWKGQRVLGDPVYSSARAPGIYENLLLEIEFRPLRQPLIEWGLEAPEAPGSFEFRPMWFSVLEGSEWRAVTALGRSGYVKKGFPDALLDSYAYERLGVWHASATPDTRDDASMATRRYDVSLRGSHDFWAVSSGGTVEFAFALQDSNRKKGRETLIFQLWKGDVLVDTEAVGIGGAQDVTMGSVFMKTLRWDHLEPGTYRLQFAAEDDVFIRSVETPMRHWVIGPRISFGDQVGYRDESRPGVAWTNSRHVVLETFHDEGLQTVTLGDSHVNVARTHEPFRLDRVDDVRGALRLDAPLGDIRIIGDGYFALAEDVFFLPEPRRVTAWLDPEREGIDAIVTPYVRPQALGDGWYLASLSFRPDPQDDELRFALSVPGIAERAGAVDIRRIRLTYRREPLSWSAWWKLIRQEGRNALSRLRERL